MIERVASDRQLVPCEDFDVPVQGGASLPELAQQPGVLPAKRGSSAIDEHVQALKVSCPRAVRLGSHRFVCKLESANQAEDSFAIVRVG